MICLHCLQFHLLKIQLMQRQLSRSHFQTLPVVYQLLDAVSMTASRFHRYPEQQASVTNHYQEDDDEIKSSVSDVYLPPPDDLEEDDGELINQIGSPIFSLRRWNTKRRPSQTTIVLSVSILSPRYVQTRISKSKLINRLG